MIASAAGHAECVYLLLGAGAVVGHADRWGRTALHLAAQNAHVSLVQMLLQAGADPFIEDCKGGVRAAFSAPRQAVVLGCLQGGPDLFKAMIQDCLCHTLCHTVLPVSCAHLCNGPAASHEPLKTLLIT